MYGGRRVRKDAPEVEAYGCIDELQSMLAFLNALIINKKGDTSEDVAIFVSIQSDLYLLMSLLAGKKMSTEQEQFLTQRTADFELLIDDLEIALPKLTKFILPQGDEIVGVFHITRTMCRRAERRVSALQNTSTKSTQEQKRTTMLVIQYLNRLSDMLFILARKYNHGKELFPESIATS